MFHNNGLRNVFDPMQDNAKRRREELGLHTAALHKLFSRPIIRLITSRRMSWAGYVIAAAKGTLRKHFDEGKK
jgi:hypothetical protein